MGETARARRDRNFPDAALLSIDPKEINQTLSFYGMNRRDAFAQFLRDYTVSFRLRSDNEGRKEIDHITDIVLSADASLFQEATFVNIASECAYFYQHIGDEGHAIILGKWTLKKAEIGGQPNLLRRAHNVLAAAYLSAFYYNEAFSHLNESLKLAKQIGEPLFEMAVLANAASLLGEIGLSAETLTVAHRVSRSSTPSALHSYVQIQNACNALRISRKSAAVNLRINSLISPTKTFSQLKMSLTTWLEHISNGLEHFISLTKVK